MKPEKKNEIRINSDIQIGAPLTSFYEEFLLKSVIRPLMRLSIKVLPQAKNKLNAMILTKREGEKKKTCKISQKSTEFITIVNCFSNFSIIIK